VSYSSSLSHHSLVAGPAGKQAAAGKADEPAAGETVVILADADLLQLPLEAVASLRADVVDAASRDISMQLLYHRLTTTPSGECRSKTALTLLVWQREGHPVFRKPAPLIHKVCSRADGGKKTKEEPADPHLPGKRPLKQKGMNLI